ncbi:hypothetical protein GUJ93_ZPchr0002g24330 [Zizania palustris]|uniref:Uncharacterized protein n=1 Tax=Zizania palustris TaxID=103762 RepID=A0A8J5RTQ0_ZIZPA|nr:hypothetical protein GUJ93_ZPchr0002g24330 [Zizania palustris]
MVNVRDSDRVMEAFDELTAVWEMQNNNPHKPDGIQTSKEEDADKKNDYKGKEHMDDVDDSEEGSYKEGKVDIPEFRFVHE